MKTSIKQQILNYIEDNQALIEGNVAEHLELTAQSEENGYRWYLTDEEKEHYDNATDDRRSDIKEEIENFIWDNFNYELTFDVIFSDGQDSNEKGFKSSLEYCKGYIKMNNGTNNSYFADYKNGTVSIICNETGDTVYETEVK